MVNDANSLSPQIKCPHCHTTVPRGATVCTGCQAEVEYGTPGTMIVLLLIAGLFGGYVAGTKFGNSTVGWVAGIGVVLAGGLLFSKLFAGRTKFIREYKT
jgi:hypothetical protein